MWNWKQEAAQIFFFNAKHVGKEGKCFLAGPEGKRETRESHDLYEWTQKCLLTKTSRKAMNHKQDQFKGKIGLPYVRVPAGNRLQTASLKSSYCKTDRWHINRKTKAIMFLERFEENNCQLQLHVLRYF